MPYGSNRDLPANIKNVLPPHAQDIFRAAFNNAWQEYDTPSKRRSKSSLEEVARRVAWAAVKSKYEKRGSLWAALFGP